MKQLTHIIFGGLIGIGISTLIYLPQIQELREYKYKCEILLTNP